MSKESETVRESGGGGGGGRVTDAQLFGEPCETRTFLCFTFVFTTYT